MSDLRDFTGKNRKFTGAAGIKVSSDGLGDGDRVNEKGRLRFNDATDLLEYYNGTDWKAIDAPPVITSFAIDGGSNATSGVVDNEGGGTVSIAINGSLFDTTGATVTAVGVGETLSPTSLTRNNANLLTAVFTESAFDIGNSPYTLKVTNGSGLSAELADAISADQIAPTFTNAADTTITLFDSNRGAGISAAALCGTTGGTAHSVTTGSLPSGLSMTSATGEITGTADAVGSDTTSTFTVTATGDDATSTRQFKITIKAPSVTSYTSTGAFSYSVPAGVSAVRVLVVAGGGGTNNNNSGGGGAGGMIDATSFPVTPGGTVPGTVGGGGSQNPGNPGQNSTFGSLTAIGGGGGTNWTEGAGDAGGSGGGAGGNPGSPFPGGAAQQPGQPGQSGTQGYGSAGGPGGSGPGGDTGGGGGGGAAQAGQSATQYWFGPGGRGGAGGNGRQSSITGSQVYYAGGGGGGGGGAFAPQGSAPGGQGGGGNGNSGPGRTDDNPGTANTGGGGGGGDDAGGSDGGSGIVVVSF
jgi:hypothetical protein